ncbi:response regulator transcription factor [Kaistella sp.]|uniref:response regulator transcription factor n=1 Tax=Kaistella sp. TaxID=2782235 RepID=UPI0035A19BFD
MKTKILLVEDDADFGLILKHYLELSDFEVLWFQNPEEVLEILKSNFCFNIGILDIMMPNIDGFSLAKIILKEKPDFPLLFLSAKNQKIDRLTGLKIGADDYIAKPCNPEELILRIKNILKRVISPTLETNFKIGEYTLDSEKLLLTHSNEKVRLTIREKDLLLYLLKQNKQTIKRDDILDNLWETNDYFTGRSLDVFISRIRKYFRHDEQIKIQSIRGVGFEIDFPVE